MRRAVVPAVLLAAAFASGCSTLGRPWAPKEVSPPASPAPAPVATPTQKVVRVIVAKPVKCVPDDVGPAPTYPDTDSALRQAGGAADRYQLLAAGRLLREQRLQKLEEIVRRCRNAAR